MSFGLKQQLQRHLVIGRRSPVVDSDLQPLEVHVCDISCAFAQQKAADCC